MSNALLLLSFCFAPDTALTADEIMQRLQPVLRRGGGIVSQYKRRQQKEGEQHAHGETRSEAGFVSSW